MDRPGREGGAESRRSLYGAGEGSASRRSLYGTDEAPPAATALRAGPLALALRGGALHDLAWDGRPAWIGVTFPHRDADWWTPPFAAEAVECRDRDGGFRLEIRGAFATAPRLRTRFAASADADGRLRVEAEAVPDGDLPTNRTGLCLLMPTAAGGDRIEVEHDDGRVTRSTVPALVPPWPPFTGIRAIRWRQAPHRWALAAFSGDSFEFEDQRNNADASFKVYSRSNMMPRPYLLRPDAPVRQALDLRVERIRLPRRGPTAAPPAAAPRRRAPLAGEGSGAPFVAMPRFGLAVPLGGDRDLLRRVTDELRPAFLHASLHADDLAAAAGGLPALAGAGAPLRLELTLGERGLSDAGLAALGALRPEAVALFPARPADVEALRRAVPGVTVGGGTPHFFAQINRIEGLGPVDHLTFTVSPLVHGADDAEVMACAGSLAGQVATLARRWPGLPVHLGPSAIAMRASPLGRMPPCDGRARQAMADDDPRARGLFGAAWVLAFAAACAAAGVAAATVMASGGPSGVAARSATGRLAWHPASAVLRRLAGPAEAIPPPLVHRTRQMSHHLSGASRCVAHQLVGRLVQTDGSSVWVGPLAPVPGVAALALRRGAGRELLVANLGPEPVEIEPRGWAAGAARAVLDEAALRASDPADGPPAFAPRPVAATLTLGAYAVATLAEPPSRGGERS